MIMFKVGISEHSFHYFEATVGLMLIALAVYRLVKFFQVKKMVIHKHGHEHAEGAHKHLHVHLVPKHEHIHAHPHIHSHSQTHKLAYGVGLVHGLAGSGALVIIAMSQIKSPAQGVFYLVIFSAGCVMGMLTAAGLFSIPFSKRIIQARTLQSALVIITAVLCLLYGGKVIYENLMALQ
jgi:ABC-type nickel/cobalt efflux system permease component RcnA